MQRALVSVYNPDDEKAKQEKKLGLPGVFASPIRVDIVQFVHSNLNKNRRQAYAVNNKAGMKHSAESWGPGRAVARVPRVSGSGTHRSGQGAFTNQCRKGRMFAPTHTWRRWHRKVNLKQRRHAAASAIAASALFPLVAARGHKVDDLPQMPLVIDDKLESYEKTKDAVNFLKRFKAFADVKRVADAKTLRAGKGKLRNRRYANKRGPLVVYSNENSKLTQAFRNIPGVDVANVNRLNLLDLAPGGQVGRFIIWTAGAVKALDGIFGTASKCGEQKKGYNMLQSCLGNADITRIINSNEVQSVIRAQKSTTCAHTQQRKNPLKDKKVMDKLNPNAGILAKAEKYGQEQRRTARQKLMNEKRGFSKAMTPDQKKEYKNRKNVSKARYNNVKQNIDDKALKDEQEAEEYRIFMRNIEKTERNLE